MTAAGSRRPTRRRPRRRRPARRRGVWIAIALIVALGVFGAIAFDDRYWHAFDDAGDVAYERGNYGYAERMYDEALQVARDLDDRELIAASLQALSRTYEAQGRIAEARAAADQARQVLGR